MTNKNYTVEYRKITYPGVPENRYLIANDGSTVYDTLHGRQLSFYTDKDGYYRCTLNKTHYRVHRLVAYEFCPKNRDIKLQIDHVDGNKQNNYYENLEWVTGAENTRRAHATGIYNSRGENGSTNKYPEALIHEICKMFVNKMNNLEVFKAITGKDRPDLNNPEDRSYYGLISHLRHKHAWPDVVSQYEYDTSSNSPKTFLPKDKNSRFALDQIHRICKLRAEGKGVDEIYNLLNLPKLVSSPQEMRRYKDVIRNILAGRIWKNISSKYFSPEAKAPRAQYEINDADLTKLIAINLPPDEIYRHFGVKFDGTKEDGLLRRAICRRILNYHKLANIKPGESVSPEAISGSK